ncbi:hypothetical protein TB1_010169 [Malus domestica]
MDNPTRWNITNSAQNIVSALVDPSKQFDNVFRREWSSTFANFERAKPKAKTKVDAELKIRLTDYLDKLETRKNIKAYELKYEDESFGQSSTLSCEIGVPELFQREDFDLSDLATFSAVMSLADGNRSKSNLPNGIDKLTPSSSDLCTDRQLKDLQQILTDYLDVIEQRLASQISNRSGDFFQVMSSVDSVMDELSLAIKSVTQLRRKCTKINENLMMPNMKSIQLSKMRDNAQDVSDKLNDISYLCRVQPMIQILLSGSDFVGALDLIAKSRVMLHKDLSCVVSLRYMESQLNEIERMIGTMMQQEFLTLISSEWDGSLNQQTSAASRLSKLFDYFANGHSEIPDRGSLTLLSLLQIQAEKFVNQFHEERKKRVESALDIEEWKVVDVPQDFQRLISMLIDERLQISEIFSRENLLQITQDGKTPPTVNAPNAQLSDIDRANLAGKSFANSYDAVPAFKTDAIMNQSKKEDKLPPPTCGNYVKVSGHNHVIVGSLIILIRTVMDYCKCAHDIQSLSSDLLERLFSILQLYNSKTYHLVYSAGAIQVAGLKTITTRSLIVSQSSLKLVILTLTSIQSHFSSLLPNDKRLRRFDEIRTIYEEHVEKIPERVKSIVGDIINLELQEWEAKPPVPSAQFTSVARHLTRLHDNILDALSDDELVELFEQIGDTFKEVLIKHLKRLNIGNDAGPQQWLVMQELTFYRISLSKLKPFNGIELNFDDIWTSLESSDNDSKS